MMDLDGLAAGVSAAERVVDRRTGEARKVFSDGKIIEAEVAALESKLDVLDEAITALNSYADQRQADLQSQIEQLVTHGLRLVFGEDMEFKLVAGTKGKYATTDFVVRSRRGDEWLETPVMAARGGGVAAVVGFILRVVLLMLKPGARRVLFLDETFAQLSAEYEPALAEFIRELVDRTGMQVVLVTHSGAYDQMSDAAYRLTNEQGRTKITRLL